METKTTTLAGDGTAVSATTTITAPKSGWKSSEFWATLVLNIGNVLAAMVGAVPAKWAAAISAASVGAYAVSRGLAKSALIFIPIIALSLTGCTGTSAEFQAGAQPIAQVIAGREQSFVAGDTTLPADRAAARIAAAQSLTAAVADVKQIDLATTAAAWESLKPDYVNYVNTVPMRADVRAIIQRDAPIMDNLIAQERQRQIGAQAWLTPFVLPPLPPLPPTTAPTTQP